MISKSRNEPEAISLFNPHSTHITSNLGEVQGKPVSTERVNLDFCLQTKTNRSKFSHQRQKWCEFPLGAGILAHFAQHCLYHSVEKCPFSLSKGWGWFILLTQGESRLHKTKSYKSQGEPGWKPKHSQHLDLLGIGSGGGVSGSQNERAEFEQPVKDWFRKLLLECRVFISKPSVQILPWQTASQTCCYVTPGITELREVNWLAQILTYPS